MQHPGATYQDSKFSRRSERDFVGHNQCTMAHLKFGTPKSIPQALHERIKNNQKSNQQPKAEALG